MITILHSLLTGLAAAIAMALGFVASPGAGSAVPPEQLEPPDQSVRFDTKAVERLGGWELETESGEQYSCSNMDCHVTARTLETGAKVPFAT